MRPVLAERTLLAAGERVLLLLILTGPMPVLSKTAGLVLVGCQCHYADRAELTLVECMETDMAHISKGYIMATSAAHIGVVTTAAKATRE